jgi:hypothetical protein
MAIDIPQDWAKGKAEYFQLTGEKKPKEAVAKFFSTSHTGLSGSLDKLCGDWEKRSNKDKTAKEYQKLKAAFESAADKYCTLLDGLIKVEATKTTTAMKVEGDKLVQEKWKTASYRGLKMLKAKLDNYKAVFEKKYQDMVQSEQREADQEYKQKTQAQQSLQRLMDMEKTFLIGLTAGYKRLVSAAQAIKSTPTVEVWNREFGNNEAARSLTTALALYQNIQKTAQRENVQLTPQQTQLLQETMHYRQQLDPWANGNKRAMANGLTGDEILGELKTVTAIGKACAAHFRIG